jgi:ATP-dependent helicase/nuclease subunit B
MLRTLMDEVAVRPPQGGHPRLSILGVIEARLQTADLMILGGLNEGVWPGLPAPDPWLAPRIRAELGLPGLERRIGLAAHDLASGAGRAAKCCSRGRGAMPVGADDRIALLAAAGGAVGRAGAGGELEAWLRGIDDPGAHEPAERPARNAGCGCGPRRCRSPRSID